MLFHHGRVSAGRAAVQIAAKLNNVHAVMLRCLVFSELTVIFFFVYLRYFLFDKLILL